MAPIDLFRNRVAANPAFRRDPWWTEDLEQPDPGPWSLPPARPYTPTPRSAYGPPITGPGPAAPAGGVNAAASRPPAGDRVPSSSYTIGASAAPDTNPDGQPPRLPGQIGGEYLAARRRTVGGALQAPPGGAGVGGLPSGFGAPAGPQAPGMPSLTGQPGKPSLWKRATDYLGAPAFPRDENGMPQPTSRLESIGHMLLGAAEGIGNTKGGGPWLANAVSGAARGKLSSKQLEEQRYQEALNSQYKQAMAQAALQDALRPDKDSSTEYERYLNTLPPEERPAAIRQRMTALAREGTPARTAEGILLDPNSSPEQRAEAQRLLDRSRELTPAQQMQEEARQRADADRDRAYALSEERLRLSQDANARAAETAARAASQPTEATLAERNRALLDRVAAAVESGGWESVPAEDRRAYNRVYREVAAPRRSIDETGTVTVIQPDVTDLPVPPNYGGAGAGATPPQPGVSQPTRMLGREQLQTAESAMQLQDRTNRALDALDATLGQAGPTDRLAGNVRGALDQQVAELTQIIGELGNTGVMQPSDVENAMRQLGGITGVQGAAASAVGLDTAKARLAELRNRVERSVKSKLPKPATPEEADNYPPGTPFLAPDGKIRRAP